MKQLSFLILSLALSACQPSTEPSKEKPSEILIVVLIDRSPSFVNRCPSLSSNDIKSFISISSSNTTTHLAVGRITSNSDIPFLRHSEQLQQVDAKESNPWLDSEQTQRDSAGSWEVFSRKLDPVLLETGKGSDVGGAISRSLVVMNEYPPSTRRYMIIASDFKNTGSVIPKVPPSIEIITVGILDNIPAETLLHSNRVIRVESFQSAFNYIISSNQKR